MIYLKSYYINNKQTSTPEYIAWNSINTRCTVNGAFQKIRPTYVGCTLSKNFKDFQYFAKWCNTQRGFNTYDENGRKWQLDKDILFKGNKLYSEFTCVFVPNEINLFFTTTKAKRGLYPIGVCKNGNNYSAFCNNLGKQLYLGTYKTVNAAFYAYKIYKENLAKHLAKKWYGLINIKVIKILKKFIVEITD